MRSHDMSRWVRGAAFVLWGVVALSAAQAEEDVGAGKAVYDARCTYCHGAEGRGDGPSADFLSPRPRDFTRGQYKVRSTGTGALPTDDDLFRIVSNGMPGTAMPGWKEILSVEERRQVVLYIKTFSKRFARQKEPLEVIRIGEPIAPSEESIAKGRQLYEDLECWKCHGVEGRGDGPSAPTLLDEWENPIRAADLTRPWTFRGGPGDEDVYRTFTTGLAGTPMPSYADVFETPEEGEEMNWHLVNYVSTLAPRKEKPDLEFVVRSARINGEIPIDPSDPLWDEADAFSYPLVGQIIQEPRWFTPSVDLVTVRSLRNQEEIGFLLEWHDATESEPVGIGAGEAQAAYPDAIALQFPATIPRGTRKPYFLMGDSRRPVNLWTWSSRDPARAVESNAEGMDKITDQPDSAPGGQELRARGVFDAGRWQVVVKRGLTTENVDGDIQFEEGRFIPIAFHAWDGSHGETGKQHAVSSWYLLYLEPGRPVVSFLVPPLFMILAIGLEFWFVRRVTGARKS